jgi:hypothetical protein
MTDGAGDYFATDKHKTVALAQKQKQKDLQF